MSVMSCTHTHHDPQPWSSGPMLCSICRPLLLIVLLKGLRAAGAQDFSEIDLLILTAKAKFCEAEASILNYNLDP